MRYRLVYCTSRRMLPRRPRRLASVSYIGRARYFLTSSTLGRHEAFASPTVADAAGRQLLQSAATHGFEVAACCFMPDHVHVLVIGVTPQADFRAFVTHFKKLSGFDYARRCGRRLWQKGYYERVLRDDQANEVIARYILENPVRAGLASSVGEYPFAWSKHL